MAKLQHQKLAQIERYLVAHGFSGDIAINNTTKNAYAIKHMIKGESFYTFGIKAVEKAIASGALTRRAARDRIIEASGLDTRRFLRHGPGYFDPTKSAEALVAALRQIAKAARAGQTIIFATGHPGAMTGLMTELAKWAEGMGAVLVHSDSAIQYKDRYFLDMIGPVFVPSDNCSAWHSHDTGYLRQLLKTVTPDMVVADHGFAGEALNHGITTIGFYDTDDPALPVAESMNLPITAVPINDNRYNADSAAMARFVIKEIS